MSPTVREDPGFTNLDEDIDLQAALEASFRETHHWQDASALLEPDVDNDKENSSQDRSKIGNDKEKRDANELDEDATTDLGDSSHDSIQETDEYGLPKSIYTCYSRWFYADMSNLERGARTRKNAQDDVEPRVQDKVIVYSNDINDHGLTLITPDLDSEEPTAIEEIVTPVITIKPSADLIRTQRASQNGGLGPSSSNGSPKKVVTAGDVVQKKLRPRLTFILETRRTTIDRRPMLRRMRTSSCCTNRSQTDNPGGVTSTSLIAPGEDCDDSDDDNEILEIDCDNT